MIRLIWSLKLVVRMLLLYSNYYCKRTLVFKVIYKNVIITFQLLPTQENITVWLLKLVV
jgi:hypothetical protein